MATAGRGRRVLRVLTAAVTVLVVVAAGTAVWLAEGDEVRPGALDDLPAAVEVELRDGVRVVHRGGSAPALGVVFLPGWRIEPPAYVPLLGQVVAAAEEAGVPVAVGVPTVPLNTAFLDRGRAEDARVAIEAVVGEPSQGWVLGGHSLGGLVGATVIEEQPDRWRGWLSWAALVPRDVDLAGTGVPALVVAGGVDDVVPATELRAALARLPATAELVVVDRMTHQQFGRYDDAVPGTGPGSDDATAAALVDTTVTWLQGLPPAS